jgi:AraC-like DNA-binding protein
MFASPKCMRDSTRVDPLSDILELADAQPAFSGGFTAERPWGIRFPKPDKLKFFAIVKGHCWLRIDGREPVPVETGDVFLLSVQRSFILSSDVDTVPVDASTLFPNAHFNFAKLGEREDCIQIGGHVRLDPVSGGFLADVLPPLIHVQANSSHAAVLQWLLQQLVNEQASETPGVSLATTQLVQLMFVQILRVHLETAGTSAIGLLRTISDKRLAPALRLMHCDPGRSWHLEDLARSAAMSRTTFASYFKEVAGVAPLSYLTEWRMHLAERALRDESTAVSTLAQSLGYTSESAFSHAFKRVVGVSPKYYRTSDKCQKVS